MTEFKIEISHTPEKKQNLHLITWCLARILRITCLKWIILPAGAGTIQELYLTSRFLLIQLQ